MRRFAIVLAWLLLAWPGVSGPLRAQEDPYGDVSFQEISVGLDGKEYRLEYRRYPEPHTVDLSAPEGQRGTAFGTAHAFWFGLGMFLGHFSTVEATGFFHQFNEYFLTFAGICKDWSADKTDSYNHGKKYSD